MKKRIYLYIVLGTVALFTACKGITKVTDAITNPSAREMYAREFKKQPTVIGQWEAAYISAQQDSLTINLPYGEKGAFNPYRPLAYSYNVNMQEGEVLVAATALDSVQQRVFTDVFEYNDATYTHVEANHSDNTNVFYEIKNSGMYKVVIQPEIAANTGFFINIYKKPRYGFPVLGKSNEAVGSFFGMERDGGKRKHEGIDIFAKRGTPVVAVTNGTITRTGNQGLGGKQVWQRDGLFNYAIYYAHLDSITATDGRTAKIGDTLGFVGNTGNAFGTPPHLHFGIYKSFSGAVNPLPFVYKGDIVTQKQFPKNYTAVIVKAKSAANIRKGPETTFTKVGNVAINDTLILLGQHKDWLHIQTTAGQKAYIYKSLVRPI